MKKRRGPPNSKSREIGYYLDVVPAFDESLMEKLLEEAKAAGVVSTYDTGRGHCVWFNGKPGAALRNLKEEVLKIIQITNGQAISRKKS